MIQVGEDWKKRDSVETSDSGTVRHERAMELPGNKKIREYRNYFSLQHVGSKCIEADLIQSLY